MEDEFYNLTVKGNDLKPYVRRFQELAVICPSMVPNTEKLLEAFIGGLPRSIEGNVTTSKPQTLEEAINISQSNEKIDIRFRRECEDMIAELKSKFNGMSFEINKKKELQYLEQESTIPLNEIDSQTSPSIKITPVLLTLKPEDSLIMGDEHLSTIPEKESDKVKMSSVEDLVPILSESEDTSGSNSDCDLPMCDYFSPINVYEEKSVTFSNPLFDLNEDFTSSDDESLSDEDVPEDIIKIYSNPLF
ncbi:hypothetical protein Tco_0449373 [Tanacetum coccineum]